MAFSYCVVSHTFSNADGTPASGSVEFTLSGRMTQPDTTIMPGNVTATLNGAGSFSQMLASNVDSATVPQTTTWRVDIRIAGSEIETFNIVVPTDTASEDLGALLPSNPYGG